MDWVVIVSAHRCLLKQGDRMKTELIRSQPRHLWFIILSYVMVIAFANWFDPRLIQLFGVVTDAGTLIFPPTFLLADLITEVYGYKNARRAIWCGFGFNALFIVYGQLVVHMPSPHYPTHNAMFDVLMQMNVRIIVASTISYFCSEPLNALVMAKLKIKLKGRRLALRFVVSTVIASAVDSAVFGFCGFYGVISNAHLLFLILNMWLIKVVIELIGLPFSVKLARRLKKSEGLDLYDKSTRFNLLSLDTLYSVDDNQYRSLS